MNTVENVYLLLCIEKNDSESKISKCTVGLDDGNFEPPTVTFNEIKKGKESKKRRLGLSLSISMKRSKKCCPFCITIIIIITGDLLSAEHVGKKSD